MRKREIVCAGYDISRSAAIICNHCAREGQPVLFAQRDQPLEPEDTGWQFTCGASSHEPENGMVVSIAEVVARDRSIEKIIDNPVRCRFTRDGQDGAWSQVGYAE